MIRRGKLSWVMVATLTLGVAIARGDPDWPGMPYTTHAAYQTVDANGAGTFPTDHAIKMRGVLINWPTTMLDTRAAAEPFLGGQWQEYIQAVDTNDFGGTGLWMGQYYGHLPFIGDPSDVYTNAQWIAELHRLDHDPATGRLFRLGDLVEVRARAPGLFHDGKTNINEQHSVDPGADFDLVLLQADYGLPTPLTITLANVKDASDQFIFDQTRLTGTEHYQGALVRIQNVQFTGGTWGPNHQMIITDGTGRTLPVLLGMGSGFSIYGPPSGSFDVLGIFDQDDPGATGVFEAGYYLWAMDYDGSQFVPYRYVKPDFNRDGVVDADDRAHFEACVSGPTILQTNPACLDMDFDGDRDVDQDDFGAFQRCWSGSDKLADPMCDQ